MAEMSSDCDDAVDSSFHSWSLLRYARRISVPPMSENEGRRVTRSNSRRKSNAEGEDDDGSQWTVHASSSSDGDKLSLNLTRGQRPQLIVLKGNLILESIFLMNARKLCKAIAKGDSILFLHKASGLSSGTRQFRVKFAASDAESGTALCENFVERTQHLVRFTGIQEHDQSNSNTGNSKDLADEERTTDIAQAILRRTLLPQCYEEWSDSNAAELENVIAFCLADPTFPAFVDNVEKCLSSLTDTQDPVDQASTSN